MRPNRSLSAKNHRPFKVLAIPEKYAVVLALPDCYKEVPSVFYFWLLHMDSNQSAMTEEDNTAGALGNTTDDGTCNYYIDQIIDCCINKRCKDPLTNLKGMQQYKVHYTSLPDWNTSSS
jgi:hypothetical protein